MATQKSSSTLILVVATLAVVGTTVLAILSASQSVSNVGNIKTVGVGVYKDSGCTQTLSAIDWGTLAPGSVRNYTAYIRSEGNTVLVLSRTINNWNPALASGYITLNWNREGYVLSAGTSVQATLTLSVASNITSIASFSFDIVITGTERT